MRTEGFLKAARQGALLTAVLLVLSAQPVRAQHVITVLPHMEQGDNPISFMRPFFSIHAAAGSSPAAPPTSAFSPAQIRHAYGFDQLANEGAGETIAIVDAFDDPNAEADLGVFDTQFKLPACTTANSCFRTIYARGTRPAGNANWDVEIALDVEWAHAIAPQARIILVEAATNSLSDLLTGVDVAVRNGASVVSMSWTTGEFSGEATSDVHFAVNGVTFVAGSGDSGTGTAYPAVSPDVIGVGGTTLTLAANGNYLSETAWSGSGGGLSKFEREPLFQAEYGIPDDPHGYRGSPDVSYNANPSTGYAIYDSIGLNGYSGWFQVGGTSAGTPQWAALVAVANSLRAAARKTNLSSTETPLYSLAKSAPTADFHAVTQGTNGTCGALCTASAGFDYVTGLGTPQAVALITAFAAQP